MVQLSMYPCHESYYSCVFEKRNYRVLARVCVCVCGFFLHDNSRKKRSRSTKSKYIVAYENSSEESGIELRRIKVKVTVGVQNFSPFTTIQTVRSYNSTTLAQARNLIIVAFLENATIEYSLESVCVCVCVSVFVWVCVFAR